MPADNNAAWPWKDSPVCLITGSAHGLGRGVAGALARRGATVVLSARDPAQAAAAAAFLAGEGTGELRSFGPPPSPTTAPAAASSETRNLTPGSGDPEGAPKGVAG